MGFSIDDIIRTDHSAQPYSPSPQLPAHLPTTPWLVPLSANNLYHFHRQSVLQYFRHRQPLSDSEAAMFLLNSFRKPKRNRTAFTPTQLLKLEDAFEKNHYIVGDERKQLARHLNLSETKIKVWYQNRRTKHKRDRDQHHVSETSYPTAKLDDDSSWNQEDEHDDQSCDDS